MAIRGRPRDEGVDAAIMTAVMDLLGEVGYAGLTMEGVAKQAQVSKASLYLRWPNKVALVAEALQRQVRLAPEVPDTGTLPGDMGEFLRGLLRSRGAAARGLGRVAGEIGGDAELRQAWHRGAGGEITQCLRAIVARAAGRGELPPGADIDLLAAVPLGLLRNWRLDHGQPPDDAVVDRIVRQFFTP